ncbi:hypothetical protein Tco_0613691 [Tanacetum coccineum]
MIVLMIEVGERLVLFQEVVDDDFGESGIWIVKIFSIEHSPQYINYGLSEFVITCHLSRETLVDYSYQSSLWLVHMIHKHVGVPVQWTLVAKINEKGEYSIIIWNICEIYTFHSWTDIKNCPKDFSIDNTLLVG